MELADLHTHTTASDGTRSPEEVVKLAAQQGLWAVAITDHDTIAGLDQAEKAGVLHNMIVIAGVEISTLCDGQDVHILGYSFNRHDALFRERLAELRKVRDRRNQMMLERLNALGLSLTMQDVIDSFAASKKQEDSVGRPHFADALVRKGYVATMKEAFDRYLGKDAAAYVNPPRIEPDVAIRWILEAGGLPVLAHPGLYTLDHKIPAWIKAGLAGIEAYHSDHSPTQEAHYAALAQASHLFITAGSDYHGERGGVAFHAPLGSRTIERNEIQPLLSK